MAYTTQYLPQPGPSDQLLSFANTYGGQPTPAGTFQNFWGQISPGVSSDLMNYFNQAMNFYNQNTGLTPLQQQTTLTGVENALGGVDALVNKPVSAGVDSWWNTMQPMLSKLLPQLYQTNLSHAGNVGLGAGTENAIDVASQLQLNQMLAPMANNVYGTLQGQYMNPLIQQTVGNQGLQSSLTMQKAGLAAALAQAYGGDMGGLMNAVLQIASRPDQTMVVPRYQSPEGGSGLPGFGGGKPNIGGGAGSGGITDGGEGQTPPDWWDTQGKTWFDDSSTSGMSSTSPEVYDAISTLLSGTSGDYNFVPSGGPSVSDYGFSPSVGDYGISLPGGE